MRSFLECTSAPTQKQTNDSILRSIVIEVKNLTKSFPLSRQKSKATQTLAQLNIIKNISFSIQKGSWTSLMGPSGSGKSTLLSLLAGLDTPTSGDIEILGTKINQLGEEQKADFRAQKMGFVFQSFRLLPTLSAFENVCVPLELQGIRDHGFAHELLQRVGLKERSHHLPSQLSGGEQQRVAVARAFVTKPAVLFADEPTGNLDSKNGAEVLNLLKSLQNENRSTLIVVTHDPSVAEQGNSLIRLRDGEIVGS